MKNKKKIVTGIAIIIILAGLFYIILHKQQYKHVLTKDDNINQSNLIVNTNNIASDSQNEEITNQLVENAIEQNNEYKKYSDNGIFKEYYPQAYEKMTQMTIDEKIGQLFLVRVPSGDAVKAVNDYQFGGYILFGKDTKNKTKDQLIKDISSWNDASKIPLLIATDEEGGSVVRISNNSKLAPSKFKSSQELYKLGGLSAISKDTKEKNELLYSLGINVNLAPVADVSTKSSDYIYKRSFGKNANETAEYIKTVISAGKETGVSNVLKHFPGYGSNVDTHTGNSIDNRSLDSLRTNDFLPFKSGIDEGAESVMVSHNIITNVEDLVPASLSEKVHNILRNELNFTGIIMTDDLAMDAVKKYVSKPAVQALNAGNDMIIITDYETGIKDIKQALQDGTMEEETINRATTKVLAWKYYKGLI